jgi:excinuclease ABC subunit A
VIGVDYGLVIPDESKTLGAGRGEGVPVEELRRVPGRPGEIREEARRGDGHRLARPSRGAPALGDRRRHGLGELEQDGKTHWYGVARFFDWLETKAYKMHIRVLLSRYRAYTPCGACEARG